LLFLTGSRVFVAPYTVAGDEFRAGSPELWSPTTYQLFGLKGAPYAVHPDGKRLAILAAGPQPQEATDDVVLMLNFLDELRRMVPAAKR
jgi:serine/threonine-protein kinase